MKWKITLNAVNQFSKETNIYTEGEAVVSIALVLKGRILIQNKGARFVVNSGYFLGVNDLYKGNYQSTYTALDDGMVYVFSAEHSDDLDGILSINKDYQGLMVASLYRMIKELDQIHHEMLKQGGGLYQFVKKQYNLYKDNTSRLGYGMQVSKNIENLEDFEEGLEIERELINYYSECSVIPIDTVKAYFSHGSAVSLYQIEDQARIINRQLEILNEYTSYLAGMMDCLVDDSNTGLFHIYVALAVAIENAGGSNDDIMDLLDTIIEMINGVENFCDRMVGHKIRIDRKRMEAAYHLLLTGTKDKNINVDIALKYSEKENGKVLDDTSDSFRRILDYSGLEEEITQDMMETMSHFINLRDRLSAEDSARATRKKLTNNHYILYKAVFLRAYRDKKAPRIVDLFLNYGYADEKLLTQEQLLELYFLDDEKPVESEINIYSSKEWLTLIYEGKKQPSKNEFDQEYTEMLAAMKKQGRLTDEELKETMANQEKKLDYEINNMFRYNNRTTSGQITTFVPVLHKDSIITGLERSFVWKSRIVELFQKIIQVDYSIFDREVIYTNKEKNITKEYVIKTVYPDVILMPNVGINSIMWQEITGKRRDSSARFLLPAFCESNLHAILIKAFGRFRWEMCRTIEGTAWNDIKTKSLTSEYSDYIQFYRKNRNLSEDKKDKIKQQIQRYRSGREVFVSDYEQWVNFESGGAIKLNKIVRELLATYCPFGKQIREKLSTQPLFVEAMARYNREKLKKIRELEGRHRLLQKEQIEITQEIIDTLEYYKEN